MNVSNEKSWKTLESYILRVVNRLQTKNVDLRLKLVSKA
jgi:hypothetical protein